MKKVVRKLFLLGDIEREEAWLNEMPQPAKCFGRSAVLFLKRCLSRESCTDIAEYERKSSACNKNRFCLNKGREDI